jgi:hypothetical protein
MNKYIIILAAATVFTVQAGMTTYQMEEKGHLPVPRRTSGNGSKAMGLQQPAMGLEKPAMELQTPAEELTVSAKEVVVVQPQFTSRAAEDYTKEMQQCALKLNDQQQFLNKFGSFLNNLAYEYEGSIKIQCSKGSVQQMGTEIGQYLNPCKVGQPITPGGPRMCQINHLNNNMAERSAILRRIHDFVSENYGAYGFCAKNGYVPNSDKVILQYQNPDNPGAKCYVLADISPSKVVLLPRAETVTVIDTVSEALEKPVSSIKSFFKGSGNGNGK